MGTVIRLDRRPSRRSDTAVPGRTTPGPAAPDVTPLWREALGRQLRGEREFRGERIVDVAGRAGLSPQYLSELERGKKDPSSEMLEALAGALDLSVVDLTRRASAQLTVRTSARRADSPVLLAA